MNKFILTPIHLPLFIFIASFGAITWINPIQANPLTISRNESSCSSKERPSQELYRVQVEAKTCSLQIESLFFSINNHLDGGMDFSKSICFELGQLITYIKLYDLALDEARDDLMQFPVEERIFFRKPFMLRDELIGACGIGGDPSLPEGDFKKLKKRLTIFQILFDHIVGKLQTIQSNSTCRTSSNMSNYHC